MKRIILAIFTIYFASVGLVISKEKVINEQFGFNQCKFTPYNTESPHTIEQDTIIDTNTEDKSYSSYLVDGVKGAKLMVKNMKLDTLPTILERGPLSEREGVLYTGKSTMLTKGVSNWYHFSGIKYDFDYPCTTLDVSFSYLNHRNKTQTGKVVVVIQQVDANDNILWEESMTCASYASWSPGWRDLHFPAYRWETRIAGREFNRVWIVESELFLDSVPGEGGYFDELEIKVEQPTAPEVLPGPEPEPPTEEPIEDGDTDDIIIDEAVKDINELCPCDNNWKNHGKYVSCVAKSRKFLDNYYEADIIDNAISEAAQSNCGKKKKKHKHKK